MGLVGNVNSERASTKLFFTIYLSTVRAAGGKLLIKTHITRRLLEMESRVAVAVSVLPWGATTWTYMAGKLEGAAMLPHMF